MGSWSTTPLPPPLAPHASPPPPTPPAPPAPPTFPAPPASPPPLAPPTCDHSDQLNQLEGKVDYLMSEMKSLKELLMIIVKGKSVESSQPNCEPEHTEAASLVPPMDISDDDYDTIAAPPVPLVEPKEEPIEYDDDDDVDIVPSLPRDPVRIRRTPRKRALPWRLRSAIMEPLKKNRPKRYREASERDRRARARPTLITTDVGKLGGNSAESERENESEKRA